MIYNANHIRKLRSETTTRFEALQRILHVPHNDKTVLMNARDVRLAVDDFKNILTEIRRLK